MRVSPSLLQSLRSRRRALSTGSLSRVWTRMTKRGCSWECSGERGVSGHDRFGLANDLEGAGARAAGDERIAHLAAGEQPGDLGQGADVVLGAVGGVDQQDDQVRRAAV